MQDGMACCDDIWRSLDAVATKLSAGKARPRMVIWVQYNGCALTRKYDKEGWIRYVRRSAPEADVDVLCNMSNVASFEQAYAAYFAGISLPDDTSYIRKVLNVVRRALLTHDVLLTGESYGGGIANRVAERLIGHASVAEHLQVRTFGAAYIPKKALPMDAAHFVIKNDCVAKGISKLTPPPDGDGLCQIGDEGRQIVWFAPVFDPAVSVRCPVSQVFKTKDVHSNGYVRLRGMAWSHTGSLPNFIGWVHEQDPAFFGRT